MRHLKILIIHSCQIYDEFSDIRFWQYWREYTFNNLIQNSKDKNQINIAQKIRAKTIFVKKKSMYLNCAHIILHYEAYYNNSQ